MNMNVFFGKIFVLALLLSAVLAAVEVFVTLTLHGIRLAGAGVAVVIVACPGECDLQLGGWDAASSGPLSSQGWGPTERASSCSYHRRPLPR